jgi:TonB family protein
MTTPTPLPLPPLPALPLLLASLAAALLPVPACAARVQDAQQVIALDLNACLHPAYPAAALAQRIGGTTTVELQVGAAGNAAEARLAVSSGRTDLDEAALAGIRRCTFPAVLATGQAPTGWLKMQYVWVPGDAKPAAAPDAALFAATRRRAADGDPAAQNLLGTWYERGSGVKADPAQAAAWYGQAAHAGDAVAQNNLGVLYFRGNGVPRDPKQAAYWYARAADQGHAWAQANLALAYQHGSAGEADIDKALAWLTRSAEGGLGFAQVSLGMLAMQRAVSDAERGAAAAWFARAAAQDYAPGLYYLGRSVELGLGKPQDDAAAAALYRRALERSGGRAEVALGMLLETGRAGAADQDQAHKLYRKAMQWRLPAAYYHYGRLLEQRGDDELATAVFLQGATLGDCDATAKYAQLRHVPGSAAAAGTPDAYWDQRAQACAAQPRPPL